MIIRKFNFNHHFIMYLNYYWRIDIPSFKNHNTRFGINADLIIDNTNYNQPEIKEKG